MKTRKYQLFCALAGLMLSFSSCKKEAPNIYNMFDDVSVNFKGDHPFSVTDYREYNEGDSIYIDYTITSAKEDMAAVCVKWEGQETPVLQANLPDGVNKRNYSGTYKMKATRAGESKFRIYALNKQAVYIGDGYKSVIINVIPNYTFVANRRVYLPDSTLKDRPCYYSIKLGQSFSYLNGKDVSADLDFGIYRTQAPVGDVNATEGYWFHLYSLSASPLFFNINDIASWTKRATLFSVPFNESSTFNSNSFTGNNMLSGINIGIVAGAKTINLKETARTSGGTIKIGSVIYFKTPEGKFGAIHVKQITRDSDGKQFFTINVKVQN